MKSLATVLKSLRVAGFGVRKELAKEALGRKALGSGVLSSESLVREALGSRC